MDLLAILQEARPVLLLEFLLLQNQVHTAGCVPGLAAVDIDLAEQLQGDMVGGLLGVGVTSEADAGGLQLELSRRFRNIGDGEGDEEDVLGGVSAGGALGPEDWRWRC